MNKIRKLFAIVLVIVLCITLLPAALAAPGNDDPKVLSADVQTLKTLGILVGSGKDGLTYEYTKSKPTRMQGFIVYLRLINQEISLNAFHWHNGLENFDDHAGQSEYVQKGMAYAKAHPELNWVGSNGKFNPMAHLTAKEYAKIMLTALGYKSDVDFTWNNLEVYAESLELSIPEGAFTFEKLAAMTVETLNMVRKGTNQKLIDYLASINPEFAAKVALLNGGTVTPDATKPVVLDAILSTAYVAGPPVSNGKVTIYFSEAMKADTLTNRANYAVDLDGAGPLYSSTQLSLMAGSAAVAAADKMSVTLTIPGSALVGGLAAGVGVTNITVSGVADMTGNVIVPVTQFVRISSVLTVLSSAAVDVNKLQVVFNNPIKTIDKTEFKLYRSDGITLASVGTSASVDVTGKIVTITLGGTLTAMAKANEADLTTAKLAVGTAYTRDIFGNAVSGAAAVPVVSAANPATVAITDNVAPSIALLVKGTSSNTFEMTFAEPVNAVDLATLNAALRIKNSDGNTQSATYAFSGAGGTITSFTKLTATITGGTDNQYSIELLNQGIRDTSGNIVKAFSKVTLTLAP